MKSNKNTINILAIGAASLIFLSLNVGCASSKIQTGQSTETSVNLSGKNYRLIEGGAKGPATVSPFWGSFRWPVRIMRMPSTIFTPRFRGR